MQKFENVKLHSVRNISAVMQNQSPREGERYFLQLTNETQLGELWEAMIK